MLLPDDAGRIQTALVAWTEGDDCDAVFTSGGTGLGPRNVTPEATQAVVEKLVPGLAELMRAEGVKKTRMAALARGIVGVRKGRLVVNLPGSPRGARESLESIIDFCLTPSTCCAATPAPAVGRSRNQKQILRCAQNDSQHDSMIVILSELLLQPANDIHPRLRKIWSFVVEENPACRSRTSSLPGIYSSEGFQHKNTFTRIAPGDLEAGRPLLLATEFGFGRRPGCAAAALAIRPTAWISCFEGRLGHGVGSAEAGPKQDHSGQNRLNYLGTN